MSILGKVFRKAPPKTAVKEEETKLAPRENLEDYPKIIEKLTEFENLRREQYRAKLQAASAFRKGYGVLLQKSKQEMEQAHKIITKVSAAHAKMVAILGKNANAVTQEELDQGTPDKALEHSNYVMKQKLESGAAIMDETLAKTILEWQTAIEDKDKELEQISGRLLYGLQVVEKKVSHSWLMYSSVARWVGKDKDEIIDGEKKPIQDTWLTELAYRSQVTKQQEVWEKEFGALETVFQSVKDLECLRRIQLRETMVQFLEEQQKIFGAVAGASVTALSGWADKDVTPESVADEINEKVTESLQASQIDFEDTEEDPLRAYENMFAPISVLESEYLIDSRVIIITIAGSSSQKAIAAVTKDGFLHLFALPDHYNGGFDASTAVDFFVVESGSEEGTFDPTVSVALREAAISHNKDSSTIDIATGDSKEISLAVNAHELEQYLNLLQKP